MRNLQEVVDMRPGSIYASFGSKEGLFSEGLDNYASLSIAQLHSCKAATASPLEALRNFIIKALLEDQYLTPGDMCMQVKTVVELTEENAELLNQTKQVLTKVEAEFANVLEDAKRVGELDSTKDSTQLAQHLQVQIMGLRTYARAQNGDAPIKQLINGIFSTSPFTAV